jgi:hypothetical protein
MQYISKQLLSFSDSRVECKPECVSMETAPSDGSTIVKDVQRFLKARLEDANLGMWVIV